MIYRALRTISFAPAPGTVVRVRRSGIWWELDLGEGIDFSIYLLGAFEVSTLKVLRENVKPGDVVFDIGANIGAHTLHLAKAAGEQGRIFAIEPTDFAYNKLTRNLALNVELQPRVTAEQLFLVDQPGKPLKDEVYSSWPLDSNRERHPKHLGRLESTSRARVETLDSFVERNGIDRVDLVKVDVDGHENEVLQGARTVLTKHSPKLVMEISPYAHSEEGSDFEDFVRLLRDCRYSLVEVNSRKPIKLDASYLTRIIPDGAGVNVIATV